MSETHVVSALRAKRAEVSRYIRELENKIKRQRANLAHIDATNRSNAPCVVTFVLIDGKFEPELKQKFG